MTAEQLEELLAAWDAGSECEGLQNLAPSLARRVIAAEKLVEALDHVLCQEDDHWASMRRAVIAYREASK